MPQTSRPFMGPNLYISPGGGFTHLHQDGHGTVDSGHYVVAGYNEVVMLRRMPERHKQNACKMIPRRVGVSSNSQRDYDSLYSLPHGDKADQGDRPDWPHNKTVEDWKAMKYVFKVIEGIDGTMCLVFALILTWLSLHSIFIYLFQLLSLCVNPKAWTAPTYR